MKWATGDRRQTTERGLLLLSALLSFGACDSSSSSEPERGLRMGEYLLETIDGDPLPAVVQASESDTAVMIFLSLTLAVDSSYEMHMRLQRSFSGERDTLDLAGGYSYGRSGDTIWIEYPGDFPPIPEPDTLVYHDGTLTGVFEPGVYVFRFVDD